MPEPKMPLEAKDGCCQEAALTSREFYIPCNQPATHIVRWIGRREPAIRMCEMCTFHNVKNRGGEIVRDLGAG